MSAIAAALIGGAISVGINWWNQGSQKKANRIASAENANHSIRQYNETLRQQQEARNLFNTNISTAYGNNFLDNLTGGADTATLMSNLAQGDTAFSKQLKEYEANAKQAMENSLMANKNAGTMANMQGRLDALGNMQLGIQSEQALGAAVGSQVTSGIRSDRGTGANTQKMQEQANRMAQESMALQIDSQNKGTMLQMEGTQVSASQSASSLRRTADMTATDALEQVISQYASHQSQQRDFEASKKAYKEDYEYFSGEAGDQSDRINTDDIKFEDD